MHEIFVNGHKEINLSIMLLYLFEQNLLKPTKGYILGEKISWVDYNLFDLLDILIILSPGCLDAFPAVKAFYERVLARPGVQKRRQTDHFKNMPRMLIVHAVMVVFRISYHHRRLL
ncbi:pi-class s-transferase glutathione, partial [Mytilus galloprovincialis]